MKLKELLKGLDVKIDSRLRETEITSVSADSRDAKKGGLFVAVEGSRLDGHKFIEEALRKGTRAVIVDERKKTPFETTNIIKVNDTRKALSIVAKNFYRSPSDKLTVLGITGTNGKTTTALLIENILNKSRIPCGLIGTIEYRLGREHLPAERTTPCAIDINALLDRMLKKKLKAAVLEVSSHALDQKRVDDIFFDAAVFTNLTHEHLDYHGSLERYFASKAKIFANLKKKGIAIINDDDKNGKRLQEIVKHQKLTYGLKGSTDIRAKVKKLNSHESSFVVTIRKKDAFSVDTKLVGLHNISNILAAVGACVAQGVDVRRIKEGIENVGHIPGRLEPVERGQGFKVFIDYAHTHNALENVLLFLNEIKAGDIITLFGCGGDRDREKRPLMGAVAQKFSNFVVVTNDNPRTENPKKIIREIEQGMEKRKSTYSIVLDRKKAIETALKMAEKNDIVLIAGKGHEKVQIIGDREIPFDDRKVVEEILKKSK